MDTRSGFMLQFGMNTTAVFDPAFFSILTRPCSFFILRHGETEANADQRIQGRSDYPLNDRGRAQAAAVAPWFREHEIGSVFCSPQQRALETARIISTEAGLPAAQSLQDLMELDTGCFTGLTLREAEKRYPEMFAAFRGRSWAAVPDAEAPEVLFERSIRVWRRLRQAALERGGNVLAVSHGGLIQWLVRCTFGCASWLPLLSTGNCGLFELQVQPGEAGQPVFMQWKEINKLPDDGTERIAPVF